MKKLYFITILSVVFVFVQMQGRSQVLFDSSDFVVEPQDAINTVSSDISPFFVGGELYYSSVPQELWGKGGRIRKNTAYYNVYGFPLTGGGFLNEKAGRQPAPGFGAGYHQGPASYCAATGELFVTVSNVSNPDSLRRMFPKANIKLKLVTMTKEDGTWQATGELPFNDKRYHFAHPAISVTGDTLVFSGDMPGGQGNSDLYMSVRQGGLWSAPVNLGEKINTPGNEMFPTFIDSKTLSFASDGHPGGQGYLDIWYSGFPGIGEVKNAGNKINSRFDDFGLVVAGSQKVGYFSSNRPGKGSDDIYRLDIRSLYQVVRGRVVDDLGGSPLPGAEVRLSGCSGKVVWQALTGSDGNFELKQLNNDCPGVEASAAGYENARKDISGLDFVELRLKQPVSYEILVLDETSKLPVENAAVLCGGNNQGKTNASGLISLAPAVVGGCSLSVTKDGYLNQSFQVRSGAFVPGITRDTVFLFRKETGKVFTLKNINYDFDKWDILPESEIELNKLVQIMNDNPGLKVELGSHTDARGRDGYNQWLSQKRSASAVAYIIGKGIPQPRIVAKGYGETLLINRCANGTDCPDWEHRQNRRTEFKIIGL